MEEIIREESRKYITGELNRLTTLVDNNKSIPEELSYEIIEAIANISCKAYPHYMKYKITLSSPSDIIAQDGYHIQIIKGFKGLLSCSNIYSKSKASALKRIKIIIDFIKLMSDEVEFIDETGEK